VNRQREQENDKGDEDLSEVDVEQGRIRLCLAREKRKNGVGHLWSHF
jgi:hypothetical protein